MLAQQGCRFLQARRGYSGIGWGTGLDGHLDHAVPAIFKQLKGRIHLAQGVGVGDQGKGVEPAGGNQPKDFRAIAAVDPAGLEGQVLAVHLGQWQQLRLAVKGDHRDDRVRAGALPGQLEGGGALGEVTVKAVGASVLLHDDFTAADVDADYSVPEQYVLGRPFTARVHFSLRENPLQPTDLGGETLEVTGLPEVLQASTYVPQKSLAPRQSYLGWGVGAAAALLALVLVLRLLRRGSGPKPFKHGKTKPITEADWSIITRQPLPAEDLTPRAKGKPSQGYGQGAGQRPRQ